MNPIIRNLALALVRKLLPEAVPENPGTALALRSDASLAPIDRRSDDFVPIARSSQTSLYVPPPAHLYPVAPAPPPRRRREVVIETITFEEREW